MDKNRTSYYKSSEINRINTICKYAIASINSIPIEPGYVGRNTDQGKEENTDRRAFMYFLNVYNT